VECGSEGKKKELAIELEAGKLTLWREIDKPGEFTVKGDFKYQGELYALDESGEASFVRTTEEGTEKGNVPWWVYKAPSGTKIALEIWDEEPCFYIGNPLSPVSISF